MNIPQKYYNQLNNFYIDNFGYEIHTQINNFLYNELKQCMDCSSEDPQKQPLPAIQKYKDKVIFHVKYPNGKRAEILCEDYLEATEVWNEWAKYSFDINKRNKVFAKFFPERIPYIQKSGDEWVIVKTIDGVKRHFGTYSSLDDAVKVRTFLEEQGWDLKYMPCNLHKLTDDSIKYPLNITNRDDNDETNPKEQ